MLADRSSFNFTVQHCLKRSLDHFKSTLTSATTLACGLGHRETEASDFRYLVMRRKIHFENNRTAEKGERVSGISREPACTREIYRVSQSFSALGPLASKEFRSRPSCAISLRATVAANAAVSVLCAWIGVRGRLCRTVREQVSPDRCSVYSCAPDDVACSVLPAYGAFDDELNLFSAAARGPACRFKAKPRTYRGFHPVL